MVTALNTSRAIPGLGMALSRMKKAPLVARLGESVLIFGPMVLNL